ncbi:MobC family plasmid mobilization relaxosome protein [Amnibacterium endophyticum]|uniref:MobC family plasmid mobilization relaxosome protein n=1 Tax=Amnibacterium endophyticum TaxID=2109337 RepID=A0ABW4LGY0_9MICO
MVDEDEAGSPRRAFGRRRRANVPAGRPGRARRYEVSVTPEEDVQLQARAAVRDVTVPRLLFESAMASGVEIAAERKQAIVMLFKLQRQMATVANNVNQLARYANTDGRFPAEAVAVVAEYRKLAKQIEASMAVVNGR